MHKAEEVREVSHNLHSQFRTGQAMLLSYAALLEVPE